MSDPVTKIRELILCIAEQKDIEGEVARVDRLIADHKEQVRSLELLRQLLKPNPTQHVYTAPPWTPQTPFTPFITPVTTYCITNHLNNMPLSTLACSPYGAYDNAYVYSGMDGYRHPIDCSKCGCMEQGHFHKTCCYTPGLAQSEEWRKVHCKPLTFVNS